MELSTEAQALFRLHIERMGKIDVADDNREVYRELEAAGLVLLSRPFTGPRIYVLTKMGWKLKTVLARMDASVPSP